MWKILPRLYLGDREDSRDRAGLSKHGMTHVVNSARELPCCFPAEFHYLALALDDPDRRFVERTRPALRFIEEGRNAGGVLVHRTAGVSRSAAVVLSYLCHLGRPLHAACEELSRSVLTGVDESFLSQLAAAGGTAATPQQLKALSLVLSGHLRPRA